MNSTLKKYLIVFSLLALVIFCLACTGCTKPADKATSLPTAKTSQQIELMPESSGERIRRHVFDEYGREIEVHVSYRNDKETLSNYFRDDGSLKEEIKTRENGQIKYRKVYATDGKTILEGQETRPDGTIKWAMEHQADGSTKTTTYWYDGKQVFSIGISRKNSYEISYFRKSGSISSKNTGPSAVQITAREFYDKSGKLASRVDWLKPDEKALTFFKEDGTKTVGIAKLKNSNWSYWALRSINEYDDTGRLTRKITLDESGYNATEVQIFHPDGSKTVRQLDSYGGVVKHEENFDASGKSTGTKDYLPEDDVRESVDRSPFWRQPDENFDPEYRWQLEEDYPYYRTLNEY